MKIIAGVGAVLAYVVLAPLVFLIVCVDEYRGYHR